MVMAFRKHMTSRGMWRLCNGPKTPAQWKSEIVTDRVMEIISQFMEVIFWFMEVISPFMVVESQVLEMLVHLKTRFDATFNKTFILFNIIQRYDTPFQERPCNA